MFANVSAAVLDSTRDALNALVDAQREPLRSELQGVLEPYLRKQIERDPPRNIALAVSYDLGLTDPKDLTQISLIAVLGGMHSLVLDDIVDNAGAGRPIHHAYVAHVLFVLATDLLERFDPDSWFDGGSKNFVDAQLTTYRALIDEELNHVHRSRPYASTQFLAEKCAPLKGIIERVVIRVGRQDVLSRLLESIDHACLALCALDDLLDWDEDLSIGRITYPIQLALESAEVEYSESDLPNLRNVVSHELVYGTPYHRVMQEIVHSFDRSRALSDGLSPQLDLFLDACLTAAENGWRDHISFLLTELESVQ